jgi:hypothetical protein
MHLEHFDEDEDLCVFEVDGPPTWDARDDGVDDRLAGQRVVIAYFEFDLVLYARDIKSEDTYVSRGSRPLIPTGRTGREVFRRIGGDARDSPRRLLRNSAPGTASGRVARAT